MDWSLYHAPNNFVYNDFLSFINCFGFFQHVDVPTRIRSNNILDLMLFTNDKFICDLNVLPPILSRDHNVIVF